MPESTDTDLTEAEFCRRFVAEMIRRVGETDANGENVRTYAEEVAPTYFADKDQRIDGPEACVDADLDEWE